MAPDALTVAVTTGLGVSVLAGILSGICYVLNQGLGRRRNNQIGTPWHCSVCGNKFRSIQGVLEVEKVVSCAKCKEKVCRIRCSKRDSRRGWICQVCQQPETWYKIILNAIHPSKGSIYSKMEPGLDELDEDLKELKKKEREQVRDFIERLIESILGGNLDDVNVGRLYNDKKYDALFDKYHSDLSDALTDLGSALHISISSAVIMLVVEYWTAMFSGFFVATFLGLWIALSSAMYYFHYVVEVILDLPITGQSPCSAHATLKHLIQRFTSEATELSELRKVQDHPALPEEQTTDRTYEDLLSTAIINKVVQSGQDGAKFKTSSASSRASRRSKINKEYFFSDETLHDKWGHVEQQQEDTSSASSLDEWVRSDSSRGSAKYVDRISLTIKQHIDDGESSGDEVSDIPSNQESVLLETDDTWNDNWYLQRRRISNNSNSPVPVPMLVPNPITEAKVFIGDKEAGELSDIESDYGDAEVIPDIKYILVNSRTIIGGKNIIRNVDELSDVAAGALEENVDMCETVVSQIQGVSEISGLTNLKIRNGVDNDDLLESEENHDISLASIDSNTEQDTEYTEQYASLPRTIVKDPKPAPRVSKIHEPLSMENESGNQNGYHRDLEENKSEQEVEKEENKEESEEEDFLEEKYSHDCLAELSDAEENNNKFEGSYSQKEKDKWKHSVEMPHNPYSPENLERRLTSRSSSGSSSSLYGRDYYIREAAKSTGARKKNAIAEFEPPSIENEGESILVTAVPAIITPDEEEPEISFESHSEYSSIPTPPTRPTHLDISSDSDISIERIYNLQSGRVIQNVGGLSQEFVVTSSRSPEGIKYTRKEFDGDLKVPVDVNHNNALDSIDAQKREFLRSLTMESDQSPLKMEDIVASIYDSSNEESIIVPYDTSTPTFHETMHKFANITNGFEKQGENEVTPKLRETLNRFDNITNEFSEDQSFSDKPQNKQLPIYNTHEYSLVEHEAPQVQFDQEVVEEFGYIIKTKNQSPFDMTPKYFGNAKKLVDNKVSTNTSDYSEEDVLSESKEFSLEYSTDLTDDGISRPESSLETDPEILDLKEKKLVKDLLGRYSKSFPNVSAVMHRQADEVQERKEASIENLATDVENEVIANGDDDIEEEEHILSVQNLKKMFDRSMNDGKKDKVQVYSLTARSLPRSFRQKMKNDDEHSIKTEVQPAENTEDIQKELLEDITKTRIAFFENLERKKV